LLLDLVALLGVAGLIAGAGLAIWVGYRDFRNAPVTKDTIATFYLIAFMLVAFAALSKFACDDRQSDLCAFLGLR
jgi:hypothetical protein